MSSDEDAGQLTGSKGLGLKLRKKQRGCTGGGQSFRRTAARCNERVVTALKSIRKEQSVKKRECREQNVENRV